MRRLLRSPWLRFAVLLVIVVAAVEAFAEGFEVAKLAARLASADAFYVAAATFVYLASWPLRGVRYRDVLARTGHRSGAVAMTGAVFVSQTANLVFPARAGDGTRAYIVKKRNGVPYTSGFASLAAERALDLVAVVALGCVGLVLTVGAVGMFEATRGGDALLASSAVAIAVLGLTVVAYFARGGGERLRRREGDGPLDRALGTAGEFAGEFGAVFEDRRGAARLIGVSLVIWLLDVGTGVALFYALDAGFDGVVSVSLLAVSVGNLAKVVPATPGGIGLYEAGFAAVVVGATGVGWETAVAVAVLDHALKNGVTVVGGVGSALALNVSLTRPPGAEADAGA